MTHLYVEHEFKPVGQGLFAYGSLEKRNTKLREKGRNVKVRKRVPEWNFHWVYDCGSSSGQTLVNRGIKDIAAKLDGQSLDLLVISHLHFDHISGLLELLKKIHVKSIMLPWAPLWQRLLIGFDQGMTAEDPELGFYTDPVTYIAGAASERFGRIIYVMPSNGGERSDPDEPFPAITPDDLDWRPDEKSTRTTSLEDLEVPTTPENYDFTRVFKPGDRFVQSGAWEFLPYNDPKSAPKSPGEFKKSALALQQDLLGYDEAKRDLALRELKKLYRRGFREGLQNDLSLSLYSGPLPLSRWIVESAKIVVPISTHLEESPTPIVYTGDGNFSTITHWRRLVKYLGSKRAEAIATFQVPHHGSRYNWVKENTALVAPTHSVFSSDPARRYGHPHAEVWRAFLLYCPQQVDKHNGFKWEAYFRL